MSAITSLISIMSSGWHELRVRPRGQVPALDFLRSAAILLVIGHHWAVRHYVEAGGLPTSLQDFTLFYYGWAGVDLFFVLSGFLIGKQLWRELDGTGTIHFGRFILRRGLRIWPVYYAVLVFYLLFNPAIQPIAPDWFFYSNYQWGAFSRGWSLSTEEQFYIAVPLLLLLFRRRLSWRGWLFLLLGIEAAVLINRHLTMQALVASGKTYADATYQLVTPFHMHLEGLLAGLIIALLAVHRPALLKPRDSARGGRGGVSWLGLSVFIGGTALAVMLRLIGGNLFSFIAWGLIFGGLTYWVLLDRSFLTRPLNWSFWYPISRLSYSMYLNHMWMWPHSNDLAVQLTSGFVSSPALAFLVSLVLVTIVSFVLAGVMFLLIEHPFLLVRDRFLVFTRRSAPRAPLTSEPAAPTPVAGSLA
ncbi:MAG: acyltransferase family protein [Gemmatimonadota bacterium]